MSSHPLVIAHRGASSHYPENTLPAFECALERLQADMIEFDVQMTRDGIPVILHDARVERTTNGKGYLTKLSLAEVKEMDAGYHFDPHEDGQFPSRGKGITIPTLEELLTQATKAQLAIEIKQPSIELLEKIIQQLVTKGCLEQAIIGSKYDIIRRHLDESHPEIPRFSSRKEVVSCLLESMTTKSPAQTRPGVTASIPLQSFGVPLNTPSWIQFLHKKGMKVFYWTVDEPERMLNLAKNNADGIVTNDVQKAREVFSAENKE